MWIEVRWAMEARYDGLRENGMGENAENIYGE